MIGFKRAALLLPIVVLGLTLLATSSVLAAPFVNTVVDSTADVGQYASLAVDSKGNPHIAYYDGVAGHLRFSDSSVRLTSPAGGETRPVGSKRTIKWTGDGTVDILLSTDGGQSYQAIAENLGNNQFEIQVPHTPTKFARVRIQRNSSFSSSESDSLITIETSIALLALEAELGTDGVSGVVVQWNTNPGPEDLAGYRLEKALGVDTWMELVPLTTASQYHDAAGSSGSRYRLYGINGFGNELLLGEVAVAPSALLAAWPLPYREGSLQITFATGGALGGGQGRAELALYDVNGRLVRTIVTGSYSAGYQLATWDGLDHNGAPVRAGIYFLRSLSSGEEARLKVVVMQ